MLDIKEALNLQLRHKCLKQHCSQKPRGLVVMIYNYKVYLLVGIKKKKLRWIQLYNGMTFCALTFEN